MRHLCRSWPLGLSRSTVWWFLAGLAILLALLYPLDHPISAWCARLPDWLSVGLAARGDGEPLWQGAFALPVRSFFAWMTRWGESDWILITSLSAAGMGWLIWLVGRDGIRAWGRHVIILASFIFLGVGLPSFAATLLKRLIGRARPEEWSPDAPLSFVPLNWNAYSFQGFPSGHTTTAFAFALTVAFLWPRALWPMLTIAALIAVSRVVLGEHYPTDVTAGSALGTLGAFAVRNYFASRGWLFAKNAAGEIWCGPLAVPLQAK